MRKKVFDEFGGFNSKQYPKPSIEDIELGFRLTQAKRKIRLNKRLQVKHLKNWTVRGLLRADILYRAIPWARLILHTRNLPRDLNLTYVSQVSAGLVGLLVAGTALVAMTAAGIFSWVSGGTLLGGLAFVMAALVAVNWRVYAWFAKRRGWGFTLGAALAHWCYYFYSGVAFALCSAAHFSRAAFLRSRTARLE
jgi:hypothetical protein